MKKIGKSCLPALAAALAILFVCSSASAEPATGWQNSGGRWWYASADGLSGWELTQYPDVSGNVGLFYSLYHPETGDLILVDGGWGANAEQVSAVIDSLGGGKVKAWFLLQ